MKMIQYMYILFHMNTDMQTKASIPGRLAGVTGSDLRPEPRMPYSKNNNT